MNRWRVHRYPMVVAVIAFMAGIILFDMDTLPWWALWGGFLLCLLLTAVGLQSRIGNLYIVAALVLFGGAVYSLRGFTPQLPVGRSLYMVLEVDDEPVARKAFTVAPARIIEYECDGATHAVEQRVNLYLDTLITADFATRIEALGRVVPFPEKFGSYGRLMSHRGFAGTVFLRSDDILKVENLDKNRLHTSAVERLDRLGLAGDESAVIGAMAVGDRRRMTSELRQAYARAGASHVLAVSGLHVGIVFLFFNLLLRRLSYLFYGNVIRAVLVVVPIWIYAAICGFSPSVVRAALMFTALQIAVATSSHYVSLNILSATAFAMLVYRPDWLFDIGFQLSFIAVVAILVWGVPIMGLLRTHVWWIDSLSATMVVGLVSSIATMPLVAHTFGIVSIVGVLLNPIVILCAYIIVTLAVVWTIMPIAPIAGVYGWVLSAIGLGLNFVVKGVAAWSWSAVELELPAWAVWVIYGVAVAITMVVGNIKPKKSVPLQL